MKGCWPSSRWPTRRPGSQDERCQNRRPSPRSVAAGAALAPAPAAAGPRAAHPTAHPARAPAGAQPADPYAAVNAQAAPAHRSRFDLAAVQGLLAVQRLDGWLLADDGVTNPIARELVNPEGTPQRRWFYLIPAEGQPVALVHASEIGDFARVPGKKIEYTGYRDLAKDLRTILKGKRRIAMEYSPKGALPSISRTDAGTLELVRSLGVRVHSSAGLVAFTKALWGPDGRKAHYVAVHHLTELRKEALAYVAKQVGAGKPVTEYDVQRRIVKGMEMRGVVGPPPVVAAGVDTADPYYVPSKERSAAIKRGDLLVILDRRPARARGRHLRRDHLGGLRRRPGARPPGQGVRPGRAGPRRGHQPHPRPARAPPRDQGLRGRRRRPQVHRQGRLGRPVRPPHRPLDSTPTCRAAAPTSTTTRSTTPATWGSAPASRSRPASTSPASSACRPRSTPSSAPGASR